MGLAHPLRRCAGFSVLGLEVFRSSRWADNPRTARPRLPCPLAPLQSMTAAASLSTPASVPRPGRPFRIRTDAKLRTAARTQLAPPSQARVGRPTARVGALERRHPDSARATPEEIATTDGQRRSRFGPQGPEPDRPKRTSSTEAGDVTSKRPRDSDGKPSSTHEGARGGAFVGSNTQVRGWSFVSSAASLRPSSPKKASRRATFPGRCYSARGE